MAGSEPWYARIRYRRSEPNSSPSSKDSMAVSISALQLRERHKRNTRGSAVRETATYSQGALSSRPPVVGSEAATKGTGC
eukprot:1185694-Prorocentrum_minimum.AAC.1